MSAILNAIAHLIARFADAPEAYLIVVLIVNGSMLFATIIMFNAGVAVFGSH